MGRRILIILIGAWLTCFILMGAGWLPRNQLYYLPLNVYGWVVSRIAPCQIWTADPPPSAPSAAAPAITVVTPWTPDSYAELLAAVQPPIPRTLVICSELDNYIVTHFAQAEQWGPLHRIVVFDGGHHLATLATAPDVVLVPVTGGYAAHTYMRDAMRVAGIKNIVKELQVPTAVVTAPRWAVVKCEWGLYGWARRLEKYTAGTGPGTDTVLSSSHYAVRQGVALAYITDRGQAKRIQTLLTAHRDRYDKIYLAFDYGKIKTAQAQLAARQWAAELDKPVEIVNEARTVFGPGQ